MANKVLASVADRVFTAFPKVFAKGQCVGNPLRAEFLKQAEPAERFAGRSGPLRLLVVGGSLGARALNSVVPQALALIPPEQRPQVIHQSGEKQIDELRANYAASGITAELTPFITDTAGAFAAADLVLCRAGASTVTELAAVGAAALFVPFPSAVDDHQTFNARFLVDQGAGWLMPQATLTPEALATFIRTTDRGVLLQRAQAAKAMQQLRATEAVVAACEELTP
jgi:UDP-N-acetylglucosamine--N-acetylmuramyl-(pentapeptide) pyrophosphoryl-undecaprenol N-acetylglucosamine transferase